MGNELMEMQTLQITIRDNDRRQVVTLDRHLSVQSHGRVVLGVPLLNRIGLKKEDYVLFGQVGNTHYICKRPDGYFGYKIKGEKSGSQLRIQSKNLVHMPKGEYHLGDVVMQEGIAWFPLEKTVD